MDAILSTSIVILLRVFLVEGVTCPTGPSGISSCTGLSDGDYQSCTSCASFVTCSNQASYVNECPASLVWDDDDKYCDYTSATCDQSSPAVSTLVTGRSTAHQSTSTATGRTTSRKGTSDAETSSTAQKVGSTASGPKPTTIAGSVSAEVSRPTTKGPNFSSESTSVGKSTSVAAAAAAAVSTGATTRIINLKASVSSFSEAGSETTKIATTTFQAKMFSTSLRFDLSTMRSHGTTSTTESANQSATGVSETGAETDITANDTTLTSLPDSVTQYTENTNTNQTAGSRVAARVAQTGITDDIASSHSEYDRATTTTDLLKSTAEHTTDESLIQMCEKLLGGNTPNPSGSSTEMTKSEVSTTPQGDSNATANRSTPRPSTALFDYYRRSSSSTNEPLTVVSPVFTSSDRRPSAIAIGSLGSVCAATPFVIIFIVDLPRLLRHFRFMLNNLRQLKRSSVRPSQ